MKLYTKDQRSTFPYWFAHWYAFNKVACILHMWKPKYLFHDIEKPWLKLIWKDYKRVQKWHRDHNTHHLTNKRHKYDWEAMIIDWECARYSKADAQMNALETYYYELNKHKDNIELCNLIRENMPPIFSKIKKYLKYTISI